MFDLQRTLTKKEKEQIAKLISMDVNAFDAFEKAYRESAIDGFFGAPAKDTIAAANTVNDGETGAQDVNMDDLVKLCDRIVDELMLSHQKMLPEPEALVSNKDLANYPVTMRPQLTGTLMKVDIDVPSCEAVLNMLSRYMQHPRSMMAGSFYGMFRQGLDILDLDAICYEMLGREPNSMGNWFPALKDAADKHAFFKVPETKIIKVPMPILQLTRLDFESLTMATKYIVNQFCMKAFDLDVTKTYFIKTGVFSSKFDFRNAKVTGEQEVRELGEYLLYITNIARELASPLSGHVMYGANTTNEWVVREYIEDKENNPCIYHGLPLHTEYRVFVDFDTDEVLGISPYWRPDVMKKRFGDLSDKNTPDMIHDYITYTAHEPTLMKRYEENKDAVRDKIAELIPDVNLKGQWSIDVMQNGDDFWLIDMATACTSALRDVVPANKLIMNDKPVVCYLPNHN